MDINNGVLAYSVASERQESDSHDECKKCHGNPKRTRNNPIESFHGSIFQLIIELGCIKMRNIACSEHG